MKSGSLWSTYGQELFSFGLAAQNAVVSVVELEKRLLEVLLQLQRVESRISKALSMRRRGDPGRVVRLLQRERQHIGHHLHTGVGQLLATISIQSEIVRKQAPDLRPAGENALRRIETLARQAHEELRDISRQLYAPEWQRLSLDTALRQLWENSGVPQRFAASIDAPALPFDPEPEIKTLVYRAAQEAISNIIRHAKASRVSLGLSSVDGWIELRVKDDGVGFDATRLAQGAADVQSGIGLRALRDEAAELGGLLTVRSGPRGTMLQLSLPSGQGQPAADMSRPQPPDSIA